MGAGGFGSIPTILIPTIEFTGHQAWGCLIYGRIPHLPSPLRTPPTLCQWRLPRRLRKDSYDH